MSITSVSVAAYFGVNLSSACFGVFVFFKDIQYLWAVFTQLLMYMSAIFYTTDAFGKFEKLFLLNPFIIKAQSWIYPALFNEEYLDLDKVIRTIPTGFDATDLIGKIFIVTGTGKYFKNVEKDPENNLGIIRIAADGTTAELLWGYKDGGRFTSELPAHLMSHMTRLKKDPQHRVVMHTHPTNTLAMTHVHVLEDKAFTHTIWEMCTECIVVFPDGVGVLPWMLCGTNTIGEATAEKMKEFRVQHKYCGMEKVIEGYDIWEMTKVTAKDGNKTYVFYYNSEKDIVYSNVNYDKILSSFEEMLKEAGVELLILPEQK